MAPKNAFLTGKPFKKRAGCSIRTAADPYSSPNPIAAPDFRWKISLDRQKQPPYTPSRQKQCLINLSIWESPLTKLFAIVGRTSFSAYAFHLILGTLTFYILGYFQKFSYGILFFCALATYFMAAATCWAMQSRFRSGIFEMLMKRMTYGRNG